MNAIQFIKEYGVDNAREVVAAYHGIPSYTFKEKTGRGYSACQSVDLSDLKRLVESVDLVNSHGCLGVVGGKLNEGEVLWRDIPRLRQAITDYEAIYEVKN